MDNTLNARKERTYELVRRNNLLNIIIDNTPAAYVVIDKSFNIVYASKFTKQLTGYSENELMSKKCYEIFGNGSVCPGCAVEKCFLSGKKETHLKLEKDKFGNPKYLMSIAIPLFNEQGELDRVLEIAMDRTEELLLQNQLKDDFFRVIQMLSSIIEAKDTYTANHSENVKNLSLAIAEELRLTDDEKSEILIAASLHDIGKVGVNDSILNKEGALTREEYDLVKKHPVIGEKILSNIQSFTRVTQYVRHHHEHFDGSGYPDGLKGNEIPLGARIISIADAFDAMFSNRSYRKALSIRFITRELKRCAGKQFDPELVDIFIKTIIPR